MTKRLSNCHSLSVVSKLMVFMENWLSIFLQLLQSRDVEKWAYLIKTYVMMGCLQNNSFQSFADCCVVHQVFQFIVSTYRWTGPLDRRLLFPKEAWLVSSSNSSSKFSYQDNRRNLMFNHRNWTAWRFQVYSTTINWEECIWYCTEVQVSCFLDINKFWILGSCMQRLVWRIGDYMANTHCRRQMHVEACIQVIVFPNEDMGKEVLVSNQERQGG